MYLLCERQDSENTKSQFNAIKDFLPAHLRPLNGDSEIFLQSKIFGRMCETSQAFSNQPRVQKHKQSVALILSDASLLISPLNDCVLEYVVPSVHDYLKELFGPTSNAVINCSLDGTKFLPWSVHSLTLSSPPGTGFKLYYRPGINLDLFLDLKWEVPVTPLNVILHCFPSNMQVFSGENSYQEWLPVDWTKLVIENIDRTSRVQAHGAISQELIVYISWDEWNAPILGIP